MMRNSAISSCPGCNQTSTTSSEMGTDTKKYLWGQEVDAHIDYMKTLWLSFPTGKKPEWLSYEEIAAYEKRISKEVKS